jgi:hypothetical protein
LKSTFQIFIIALLFVSCGEERNNNDLTAQKKESKDTSHIDTVSTEKQEGIVSFIEFMHKEDLVIDTIRLSQVWAWKEVAKSKKEVFENIVSIKFQFPVETYRKHFSDPKTYFLVKRNHDDPAKNDGLDFLLMTYQIDSAGIKIEQEIYRSLSSHYLNFPTYCFRDKHQVYILSNRLTANDNVTQKYSKSLRDIINPKSALFGHHEMELIQ